MKFNGNRLTRKNLFYTAKPQIAQKPVKKSKFIRLIKWVGRVFLKMCTILGLIIILSTFISSFALSFFSRSTPVEMPPQIVLQMTLKDGLPEKPQKDPVLAAFGVSKASLYEVINALKTAKTDESISAFVLELRSGAYAPSQLAELREAIIDFKTSEKPTIIYAPSYDALGVGLASYYLASAFDEIWMQPVGMMSLTGFYAEQPYIKKTMDWLGVKADVFKRKEYKSAMDNMIRDDMSAESREAMGALFGDFHDAMSKAITESRNIDANIFQSYVNTGILTDKEALEAKLVDRLGYGDELVLELNERLGGTKEKMIPYIGLDQYNTYQTHGIISPLQILSQIAKDKLGKSEPNTGEIALIFAQGPIVQYAPKNHGIDLGNSKVIAAESLAEWIYDAARDKTIKTIVLRIDSPGGSPQASETVRRALQRAKDEGKRVVVSMGSMAASGGYWIASVADHIFANEMTITGSIGVIGAKFNLQDLWAKAFVNWDAVSTAENANLFSTNVPLSESGAERYNEMMDVIYDAFVTRVADGRNLSYSSANEVAKGRVWSGKRALDNKLVDTIGGLEATLIWAAKDLGHETVSQAGVTLMPSPEAGLHAIMSLLGVSVGNLVMGGENIRAVNAIMMDSPIKSLLDLNAELSHQKALNVYTPNPLR
jgi:protease-4